MFAWLFEHLKIHFIYKKILFMLLIMFSDAEAVLMFVRMMGVRLVLEPLFKKMEEARVRLQVKVVIYHVMSFPSLKNF